MSSFFPHSPPAHSFFIGPTVINIHTLPQNTATVYAEVAGHGGVYCERNTERNTKKHPEIVLPPRKKLFYKAVLQATEDGSSLGRRRAGPGPCHVKKLLPSRYTVAQSVASCLLARHITPSVPRHAIGMPSASRHITKGGGGGKS